MTVVRAGLVVMASQHLAEALEECFDFGRVENAGVEFDAEVQFVTRYGLDRQRVMVVLAVAELGDGQPVDARQCGGVERVVLVDEKGVEQLVVPGDAMNVAERQVLVVEGVVMGAVQLVE